MICEVRIFLLLIPLGPTSKLTWKIILSYVLIDQAFAVSNTYFKKNKNNTFKHYHLLGAGFTCWTIWQISTILGIILGIFLAKNYYPLLDEKLFLLLESDAVFISLISALTIFLFTIMVIKLVASFLTKFLKLIALGLLNKMIGALFGVLKSVLILCVIIFIFSKINLVTNIIEKDNLNSSFIYSKIEKINKIILYDNYPEYGNDE